MPTTPGVKIDDLVTWDRVMAAFKTVEEFQKWQRQALRDEVISRELAALTETQQAARSARIDEIKGLLAAP